MKNKKFRTSKVIMVFFILLLTYVVIKGVNIDFSSNSYMDTALYVAIVGAISGITGACIVQYFKNSNQENIPRIELDLYQKSIELRLNYDARKLELMNKYNITESEFEEVDDGERISNLPDSILDSAIDELSQRKAESHSDTEIQNY